MHQMEEAVLFAWKGLTVGSAAADNKGRINPSSHPVQAVTFSQPRHCDQSAAVEKIKRTIDIILQAEDEITRDLLFLQG